MIFFEDAYNEAKKHEDEYFIFLQEYLFSSENHSHEKMQHVGLTSIDKR